MSKPKPLTVEDLYVLAFAFHVHISLLLLHNFPRISTSTFQGHANIAEFRELQTRRGEWVNESSSEG